MFRNTGRIWNITKINMGRRYDRRGISTQAPVIKFLWGSQTGTAHAFAEQLKLEGEGRNFASEVVDLNDYQKDDLKKDSLLIFVTATYGKGEPTDNAKNFVKWLHSPEVGQEKLDHLKYCIFGLGKSKTYADRYQAASKMIEEGMKKLGAHPLLPRGEGDDDADSEADFMTWKEKLWEKLDSEFSLATRQTVVPKEPEKLSKKAVLSDVVDIQHPVEVPIIISKELHGKIELGTRSKSCKNIEFDISGTNITYQTGDHLGVFAQNEEKAVTETAERLGVSLDSVISLEKKFSLGPALPVPCTARTVLSQFCDLNGIAKRAILDVFGQYASDEKENRALKFMASSAGTAEYTDVVVKNGLTVPEILQTYKSVRLPFTNFLEAMLRYPIQCRYYSISSSSLKQPRTIGITMDVIGFNSTRHGLCSYYLGNANRASIFVRESNFKLPKDLNLPVILVGAGSGIAPLWAFIQERAYLKSQGIQVGETILAFGCYHQDKDFLYKDELLNFQNNGIVELYTAFSHDQPERIFVQHKLLQNSKRIWALVKQGAHVYICGNGTTLGPGIFEAFVEILRRECGLDEDKAKKYVQDMQCEGRYHEDLFFNIN